MMVNIKINDNWSILKKLHSGSFGSVFQVENRKGEIAALKLIDRRQAEYKNFFKANFYTASKLEHKNCVKLYEWFESGKDFGFIMEFVKGFPISQLQNSSLFEIVDALIKVCNGLDALHRNNIIHCDLKPENILITEQKEVKLIDFDLIKSNRIGSLRHNDLFRGSILYSSPEQCVNSKHIDQRSDLYSLGIILYELVTGKTPFNGKSISEIARKHISEEVAEIRNQPQILIQIIKKLLAKNPRNRYRNARDLAVSLQALFEEKELTRIEASGNYLVEPKFIDREKQLQELKKLFDKSAAGSMQVVLICGKKGIGKSRLIRHFLELHSEDSLIIELSKDDDTTIKSTVIDQLREYFTIEPEEVNDLSELFRNKFFSDRGKFKKPVIIAVDKHFLDVKKFLRQLEIPHAEIPVLFVISSLHKTPDMQLPQLELTELNFTQTEEMIYSMLGDFRQISTGILEKIYRYGNGNPLYTSEMMRHLFQSKALQRKKGIWKFSFGDLEFPGSIEKLMLMRLEKITSASKNILSCAAVIGAEFRLPDLVSLTGHSQERLIESLNEILENDLISYSIDDDKYYFNMQIDRVLNDKLSRSEQKKLHTKQAGILVGKNKPEFAEKIADHYQIAGAESKADKFYRKAAEYATEKHSYEKAIGCYDQIIRNMEAKNNSSAVIDLMLEQIRLYELAGKWELVESSLSEIMKSEQLDDDRIMECYERYCRLYFISRRFEKSAEYCRKICDLASAKNDDLKYSKYTGNLGNINQKMGNNSEAISLYQKQKKLSEKIGMSADVARASGNIGFVYFNMKKFPEAEKYYREYFALSRKNNLRKDLGIASGHLGMINLEKGKLKAALGYFFQELRIMKRLKDKHLTALALGNIGVILSKQNRYKKAIEYYQDKLKIDKEIIHYRGVALGFSNIANNYKILGLLEKAEELYISAIELCRKYKMPEHLARIMIKLADLYFRMDKLERSKQVNKEVMDSAQAKKMKKVLIDSAVLQAKTAFKEDRPEDRDKAIFNLQKLIIGEKKPEILAKLYYQLYLQLESEYYRKKAHHFLREQFRKTPGDELKQRLEKLEDLEKKQEQTTSLSLISSLTKLLNPITAYKELLKYLQRECLADNCRIVSYDKKEDVFHTLAVSSSLAADDLDFSQTILMEAMQKNKTVFLENAVDEDQYQTNKSIIGKPFLSVIAVPLNLKSDLRGALYLDRRNLVNGHFSDADNLKVEEIARIITPILFEQEEFKQYRIKSLIKECGSMIGESEIMQELYKKIYQASAVDSTVYIYGESGTGKELVARALHNLSDRNRYRFVAINCAAIPSELAESELFGHEKGAFTGANLQKKGKFEQAHLGTIFLDEIGELSAEVQAKLLRILEEKEITRIGGEQLIQIDVRIIVATQKDLDAEVQRGNFRKDLLHRLNILTIIVPPLRDRKSDIPILAENFLKQFSKKYKKNIPGFTSSALKSIMAYDWKQNNVRELRNKIERAVVQHDNDNPLKFEDIFEDNLRLTRSADDTFEDYEGKKLDDILNSIESNIVEKTLNCNNWNKSKTAEQLRIGRPRLDRIIKANKLSKL